MNPRPGPDGSWLLPVGALSLAVVLGISWFVLRPSPPEPVPVVVTPAPDPDVGAATFTFGEGALPYESARLDVRRTGGSFAISASATRSGEAPAVLGSVTGSDGSASWVGEDDALALGVVPGHVQNVGSLDHGRVHAQYLETLDLTAVAVERSQIAHPELLIWTGADGRPHDSRGSRIASVAVSAGTYAITVFEDAPVGTWGYFDRRNNVWMTEALPSGRTELLETAGPGFYDGEQFTEASWVALLPVGARHPELETDPGVVWDAEPLGSSGRLALVVFADSSRAGRSGVRSISYTDVKGARHTERP